MSALSEHPAIRGLVQTRRQLTGLLRAFHLHGPRGLFAFGRHHRAEAVILAWPLFEQLSDAAHALQDAAHAVELDRRRRNPRGAAKVSLNRIAELLDVDAPGAGRARKGAPGKTHQLTAWPTALDDLMRIGEEHPPSARAALARTLGDIVRSRQVGAPMVSAPGQPSLDGYRRTVVPLSTEAAAIIVFGEPACAPGDTPTVDLLAVLTAGPLVTALHAVGTFADLDELPDNDENQ